MKKIYLFAAATLSLVACDSNDDNPDNSQQPVKIFATIGESAVSRASDTKWAPGDKIGISSSVGAVGGPYVNVLYTTDNGDGNFIGAPLFYYKPMTLTAYYPFTGTEGTVPGNDGIISATTDAEAQKNLPAIDFLWDQQTGLTPSATEGTSSKPEVKVKFTFAHKMSKLMFAFKGTPEQEIYVKGIKYIVPEVKVSDMVAYELEGLVMGGTFNTADGICAIKNVAAENLKIEVEKGTVKDETPLSPLIVFPQKPGNTTVKLRVYNNEIEGVDDQTYTCTLSFGDGELKPGYCYKYTIQITKIGLILEQMSIVEWEDAFEETPNLAATIDGGWTPDGQQGD